MSVQPAIKAVSLLRIGPFLAAYGMNAIEFLARHRLTPNVFQNPDGWIPRARCFSLAEDLAMVTGNPYPGAFVGSSIEIGELGQWGRHVLASETIGRSCVAAETQIDMLHQGSRVRFEKLGQTARLRFAYEGRCEHNPAQFILGALAVLRKVPMLANEFDAVRVCLRCPYTKMTSILEECLGANLAFGCRYDAVEFDREILDLPVPARSGPTDSRDPIRTAIAAAVLIAELLPTDHVSVACIAQKLNLSVRTLQRRLKYCGILFEDLLDVTRRDEAIRQLSNGTNSMTELALQLGYSDTAHFSRAFRRWTGVTPSHFLSYSGENHARPNPNIGLFKAGA